MTTCSEFLDRSTDTQLKTLAAGTLVRIQHNDGQFKIVYPSAWSDSDYKVATHYDVTGKNDQLHRMVPFERIITGSSDSCESMIKNELSKFITFRKVNPIERMLKNPDATMRMHRRFFSGFADDIALPLRVYVEMLAPRYIETHCWSCKTPLNNLDHTICKKCGGIHCGCGACFCNQPKPQS